MATKTFIGGNRNNTPNDPQNWTPSGPPAPGDTAIMGTDTMNIGIGQFTADVLTLPNGGGGSFNLFDGAVLKTTIPQGATAGATVNVQGRATATLKQEGPSTAHYAINLQSGSTPWPTSATGV